MQRVLPRSHDHGPHYHPVHTPMPMLPSYESTKILIKTHPFTCASYNPFESLHIDHIGPLPADDKGNSHILVMIDAFSRWVELFLLEHSFSSSVPIKKSCDIFVSCFLTHACTTSGLTNSYPWYNVLSVEKTSTGVTPAELILNNSIRLSNRILAPGSTNLTNG